MAIEQAVSTDQLARLYQARNDANKRMSQALRTKDKTLVKLATDEASNFNRAYAYALRSYKRQQKAAQRSAMLTTMIKFYLDCKEANQL